MSHKEIGPQGTPREPGPRRRATAAQGEPVCGVTGEAAQRAHRLERGGRTYVFCCRGCLEKFRADPERYLQRAATDSPPHAASSAGPMPAAEGEGAADICPRGPEVARKSVVEG